MWDKRWSAGLLAAEDPLLVVGGRAVFLIRAAALALVGAVAKLAVIETQAVPAEPAFAAASPAAVAST
jgi:hypothetical protein